MLNFALLAALVGCSEQENEPGDMQNNDDNASYMPYCEDTETPITIDEVTAMGISGQDLMDNLALNYTTTVSFADGTEACLSGAISPDTTTFRFVESVPVYPEAPAGAAVPSIAVECSNYIAVDGTYSIASEGGALDEEAAVTFTVSEWDLVDPAEPFNAKFSVDIDALSGTLDTSSDEQVDRLTLQGEVGQKFMGSLTMQTTSEDGDIAMATIDTLAEWSGESAADCDGFE